MNNLRNIIVTGSNKGIGYGIVENLAGKEGWNIIMACRSKERGEVTRKDLLEKFPHAHLHIQELDVSKSDSIDAFVNVVKQKYKTIDVLVNNAGCAAKGDAFDMDVVKFTFETNYYGTIEFTEKILANVSESGKIIFIGSMAGKVKRLSEERREKFMNPNLTKDQLTKLIEQFSQGVRDNNYAEKGYPKSIYGMSKVGINVFARVLSNYEEIKSKKIQVYTCCPGYCDTDMTSHKGPRPIKEGALTPVYLINLPFQVNPKFQGQFFENQGLSSLLQ